MHKENSVSVIIPVYNGGQFIAGTINSVLNQPFENLELIIVNDGSTDNTNTILQTIKHPNLKIITQKNKGVSTARNNGFKEANGNFICFFDADDIMPEKFIQDRVHFLSKNPSIDFCCSDFETVNPQLETLRKGGFKKLDEPKSEILLFSSEACTTPSSFLFRKKLLYENNIEFNLNLSNTADRLFILECSKYGKGSYFSGSPFIHPIYPESMSAGMSQKILIDFEWYVKLLIEKNIIPLEIKKKCLKIHYRILTGISFRTKNYLKVFRYLFLFFKNI